MDCIVHGVPKSRTQLSDFHFFLMEITILLLVRIRITGATSIARMIHPHIQRGSQLCLTPSGGLCQCWRDVDLTLLDPLILLILSFLTLLPHQLVSRWYFPRLCLGFGSVYLLWSLTTFLFPEILGFGLPATKIYVFIFRCDLLLLLNPVLCPAPACPLGSNLWSCFYSKGQKVLVLLVVYVASGPWFCSSSSLLYPLHIWACPRSARLGSSFFSWEIILPGRSVCKRWIPFPGIKE